MYSEGRYIAITRRKIAKRMKYSNYKDVLANASKKEKELFFKELKKNLKEFMSLKFILKKCVVHSFDVPTSRLSKHHFSV